MKQRVRGNSTGASTVELAFTLPVFMLIMLAILELSSVFFLRHAMLNSAGDAARSYAIGALGPAETGQLAQQRLATIGIPFTVQTSGNTGPEVWVEISTPLSEATLGDPLGLFGGGDLTVRATMRREA